MNKHLLAATVLIVLAMCTTDIRGAAFNNAPSEERGVSSLLSLLVRKALRTGLLGDIPSSSFASQAALTEFFYNKLAINNINNMLPDIADEYYRYVGGNVKVIPEWLAGHLNISVQDLIDSKTLPAVERTAEDVTLRLPQMRISNLSGIQNIPDADTITDLYLNDNLIAAIDPNTFVNFKNLDFIDLQNNKIGSIAPEALRTPKKIHFLYLRGNPIPENERPRIQEEVGSYTTIFW